jgi:hypothetical protein
MNAIWAYLDELSAENPEKYHKYIQTQLESFRAEALKAKKNSSSPGPGAKDAVDSLKDKEFAACLEKMETLGVDTSASRPNSVKRKGGPDGSSETVYGGLELINWGFKEREKNEATAKATEEVGKKPGAKKSSEQGGSGSKKLPAESKDLVSSMSIFSIRKLIIN